MNQGKISVRYSRALFNSATEKNLLDKVYHDMIYLSEICVLPEMKELLNSPIIIPSKKREIFHNVTAGEIHQLTLSLIDLVVKNGRESFLPAIAREFIRQTKIHQGITESVLTTAVKTDEKTKKQIRDFLSGLFKSKIELKEVVDKEIIGGFILRVEDSYIDASIKNKLRKIEKELKNTTLST